MTMGLLVQTLGKCLRCRMVNARSWVDRLSGEEPRRKSLQDTLEDVLRFIRSSLHFTTRKEKANSVLFQGNTTEGLEP